MTNNTEALAIVEASSEEIAPLWSAAREPPYFGTVVTRTLPYRLPSPYAPEPSVVESAEQMFLADFARSTRATAADYTAAPWWFRLAARTSRLMAPVQ